MGSQAKGKARISSQEHMSRYIDEMPVLPAAKGMSPIDGRNFVCQ